MIKTEYYSTRKDGVVLERTYSTERKYIIQDGTGDKYTEAIDPDYMHRTYTESDELIPEPEPDEVPVEETEEQKGDEPLDKLGSV